MLFPVQREAALNAQNALFGAGACLGPLLARFSLAQFNDYRPAYLCTAALLAAPALPLLAGLPRKQAPDRAGGSILGSLFRAERRMWAYAALSFFYLGAEIGFGGWIVPVLQQMAHLSAVAAAPIASVYWLFLALGGVPTAVLLQRGVRPARIVVTAAASAAVVAATLALFGSIVPVAALTAALMGLSLSPILPLNLAAAGHLASARTPASMGRSTALVLTAAQLGGTVLPLFQGFLLTLGAQAAIGETCLCSLCMLTIQYATMRGPRDLTA
jgi:fucose permease